MKISPRYDGPPIVELDGPRHAVAAPLLRQRRRLAAVVRELTAEQWEVPSRCDGWRVKEVVAHLAGVDRFWNASVQAGLSGTPTRFLEGFDPKSTPAVLVESVRDDPLDAALSSYTSATEDFCATVEALDAESWNAVAESPAGHVDLNAIAHHALWDAWVHERDILVPLGLAQDEEADEIVASLRYAAALSPMFATQVAGATEGSLEVGATNPDARFSVVISDGRVRVTDSDMPAATLRVEGQALDLLEAFSVRTPFPVPIPPDAMWLVTGLARVFESAPD